MRKDKINYYLDIAEAIGERSTCLRGKYGCDSNKMKLLTVM